MKVSQHRYSFGSTSSGSDRHDVITNSDLDRLRKHVAFSCSDDSSSSSSFEGSEDEIDEEIIRPMRNQRMTSSPPAPRQELAFTGSRRRETKVPRVPSYKDTKDQNGDAPTRSKRRSRNKKTEHGFLRDVQHELEDQRTHWSYEVDRLLARDDSPDSASTTAPNGTMTSAARAGHSFVDTSNGQQAVYTAYVDVREYPARCVQVYVDTLTNQIIVKAEEATPLGAVTKTFTQKLTLPRFADETRLESKMNNKGLLRIRVPLLYHFAQKHMSSVTTSSNKGQVNPKDAKSFVYQVNKTKDGRERLELLVNTGTSYSARDLEVTIDDDNKLLITANNGIRSRLLKQYTLPSIADINAITSRLTRDGRLQVNIPLNSSKPTHTDRRS